MNVTKIVIGSLVALAMAHTADAQVIGTFSWQTQPYCNVLTVTVVRQGGVYQLHGSDDLCGTGLAPVTGTAIPSGAGVQMALMVHYLAGRAVHLTALVSLAGFAGNWSDETRGGPLAFGVSTGGAVRPTTGRAVTGGNGEAIGASVCTGAGVEVITKDAHGNPVDARFTFVVPGYAHGHVLEDGTIRSATSNLTAIEHPLPGGYCLVFANPQPTQLAREATVVSIHANR